MANETFFITGFPGFIASRLLRRLAEGGDRFLLLVQPALAEQAGRELSAIAEQTRTPLSNFELLHGDITEPDLALTQKHLERARAESTILFHLAAIYDL